ncbi:MAG: hypothetical protein WDW36_005134 [Sanguina aurantia]
MPAFWRFSMDEFILGDLPDTLKYVLRSSGKTSLAGFIGHSQGATISLGALAAMPSLAASMGLVLAVAPSVYVKYMQSPVLVQFSQQANSTLLSLLIPSELYPMSAALQANVMGGSCQAALFMPGCLTSVQGIFGVSTHISTLQYRKYWQVWPSATSTWNGLHWAQIYNEPTPRFMMFNRGPEYDLTKIKARIILFTGGQDLLSTPKDNALVRQRLTAGGSFLDQVNIPDYGHMDFIWDTGANTKVYPAMMTVLNAAAADLFPGFKAMAVVPPRAVSTLAGWGLGFLG